MTPKRKRQLIIEATTAIITSEILIEGLGDMFDKVKGYVKGQAEQMDAMSKEAWGDDAAVSATGAFNWLSDTVGNLLGQTKSEFDSVITAAKQAQTKIQATFGAIEDPDTRRRMEDAGADATTALKTAYDKALADVTNSLQNKEEGSVDPEDLKMRATLTLSAAILKVTIDAMEGNK